jgi:adenine-specific DNA-methyltransferase
VTVVQGIDASGPVPPLFYKIPRSNIHDSKIKGELASPDGDFSLVGILTDRHVRLLGFGRSALVTAEGSGAGEWRNRLVWGDKKYVLPSLLAEFAGNVNLIYIDPPFDTGADFSFTATVPDHPDTPEDDSFNFTKEPSIIEHKAYRDTWGRGLESYLQWFYETVVLLHELLHETGSIYVHLDWHVGHYAKAILDEVFGNNSFHNEIVWKRTSGHSDANRFGNVHDVILFYSRSEDVVWNQIYQTYDKEYVEQYYRYTDPDGRKWMSDNLNAAGLQGGGYEYDWKGIKRVWRLPKTSMERLDREGKLYYTKNGIPRIKLHASGC